jgi:FMN phosphatase YigB (HAD superfamily)
MSAARGLLLDTGVVYASPGAALRPEARAVVGACAADGIPVGYWTEDPHDERGRALVEETAWGVPVPAPLGSGTVGPDPELYRSVVEHFRVEARRIVYVDARSTHVRAAEAAGLRSILLVPDDPAAAFRKAVLQLGLPWSALPAQGRPGR